MSQAILEAIDHQISVYAHRDLLSAVTLLDILLDLRLLVAAEDALIFDAPLPEPVLSK